MPTPRSMSRSVYVSRPNAKINCLFDELQGVGSEVRNLTTLAQVLDIEPNTLSGYFGGGTAQAEGSMVPRKHLVALVNRCRRDGVAVELAWFEEDAEQFRQRLTDARGRAAPVLPVHDVAPTVSTDQWIVSDANNISMGMAAMYLHPPAPGNDPNTFLLQASLSLAHYKDEIEDLPVRIGLKTAYLTPVYTGCQPSEQPAVEHLTERGGNFDVDGPRDAQSGLLAGKPLEKTTLAVLEYTSGEPPAVRLALRSRRLDLEVVPDDPARDISAARAKVLQRFLQECQVSDSDRHVTWSRARLRRKPDHEADA